MDPESNKIKDQTESNVKIIRDKMIKTYPKIKNLIEQMSKEDLLRVNYWDSMTVKELCPILRQFFKKINIFRE
jgi:pyruvate dehydrogenase complex dehydrogenase (E1) component